MTEKDHIDAVMRLLTALLKHQVERILGEDALGVLFKELAGLGGENLQSWLEGKAVRQEIENALARAEACVQKANQDAQLAQWIQMLPLGRLPGLVDLIADLPNQVDDDQLAQALRDRMRLDWKNLSSDQIDWAVEMYLHCLRRALLPVEKFTLATIGRSVLITEEKVNELMILVRAMLDRLERQYPIPPHQPPPPPAALLTISDPPAIFTGREAELARLMVRFHSPPDDLTTSGVLITGGAGIGKTALARQLAGRLADVYPVARLEIDLRGVSSTNEQPLEPAEAMRRLLAAFYPGAPLPYEQDRLQDDYQNAFHRQPALLLLDNALGPAQVRPLLPPSPSAAIVTSRQHFSLTAEGLTALNLDLLGRADARQLLCRVSPRLAVAPQGEVDRMAQNCGCLPLALRVAADLLEYRPDWTLEDLFQRLSGERTRLAFLYVPGDPELNVAAAIQLSYDTLPSGLQARFRALGVFPGPFTAAAAASLWEQSSTVTPEVDDSLGALLNRSLLEYDPNRRSYQMHDLTRLYAYQRLSENPAEAEQAFQRHAGYYLAFSRAHAGLQADHFDALQAELGNLEAALLWADQAEDAQTLIALGLALRYFLDVRGYWGMAKIWLKKARAASLRTGDQSAQADLELALGMNAYNLGDFAAAEQQLSAALAIYRALGQVAGLQRVQYDLGLLFSDDEQYERALDVLARGLAMTLAQANPDWSLVVNYRQLLAKCYILLGKHSEGLAQLRDCLAIHAFRRVKDYQAYTYYFIGMSLSFQGCYPKARYYYHRALQTGSAWQDQRLIAEIKADLGEVLVHLGVAEAGRALSKLWNDDGYSLIEQALELAQKIGDRRLVDYIRRELMPSLENLKP
jgi:hypothetical protein